MTESNLPYPTFTPEKKSLHPPLLQGCEFVQCGTPRGSQGLVFFARKDIPFSASPAPNEGVVLMILFSTSLLNSTFLRCLGKALLLTRMENYAGLSSPNKPRCWGLAPRTRRLLARMQVGPRDGRPHCGPQVLHASHTYIPPPCLPSGLSTAH